MIVTTLLHQLKQFPQTMGPMMFFEVTGCKGYQGERNLKVFRELQLKKVFRSLHREKMWLLENARESLMERQSFLIVTTTTCASHKFGKYQYDESIRKSFSCALIEKNIVKKIFWPKSIFFWQNEGDWMTSWVAKNSTTKFPGMTIRGG